MLTKENHPWLEPLGHSNFLAQDAEPELGLLKPSLQRPWLRMQSTRGVTSYKWRQASLELLELAVPETIHACESTYLQDRCLCPVKRKEGERQYGY